MFYRRESPQTIMKPRDSIKPHLFIFGSSSVAATVRGSVILLSVSSNELPVVQLLT